MRGNDDAAVDLLQLPNTNIEAQDQQRLTPLHLSCNLGQTAVAKILLEHGANIHCFGEQHQTPLHKAAAVGNTDLVRLLISASVQVTYQGVLSTCRVQLDLLVRSVRWT
jgi:cytohesin